MAIQTQQLVESLPHFATLFKLADSKGAREWQIVRWQETDPGDVIPNMVTPVKRVVGDSPEGINQFGSRTQALRASRDHIKRTHPSAIERGHWGVWQWIDNGSTHYQSVMPITDQLSVAPGVVIREPRTESYSPLIRVSEEANRRLREMAAETGSTLQSVLDSAVMEYYRQWFFGCADVAYLAQENDARSRQQESDERRAWDTVLLDGIDRDEVWQDDRTVRCTGKVTQIA